MSRPDPKREPRSETPEKKNIGKTHEEFIGDMAQPSVSKSEYRKKKAAEKKEDDKTEPRRGNDA